MSIIKAPCGLNLDSDTFEVEGQVVKGKGEALQPATADKLGGVKIGEGVNVEEDGTISVTSGGGGNFVITLTQSGGTYSSDKTFEEITTALTSGNNVIALDSSTGLYVPLTQKRGGQELDFVGISDIVDGDGAQFIFVKFYANGNINVTFPTIGNY